MLSLHRPTNGKVVVEDLLRALVDIAEGIENTDKICVRLIILKHRPKKEVKVPCSVSLKLEKVVGLGNMAKHLELMLVIRVMLEVCPWKKILADTNLHVHLEEIKVDKTFRFVEEPVGIIDHEVKSLKRSRIPIVKSIGTRSEVMRIS
ncbi:hypothetical protein Tco_0893561 [Tanacetum coccineum]|uniref:Uncharacterized protein n=1 Tax=Tanacetum coccineum TaxID=301880 RepID=A0ABQ5CEK2_9ASTR